MSDSDGKIAPAETAADRHIGQVLPSSFRDPSGFLFERDGVLYRQINRSYADDYELLTGSGLLDRLTREGVLIPHAETDAPPHTPDIAHKVILPELLPFVSYPYEWSFSQLRDAALLTLKAHRIALDAGMSLKDASAYNIQFLRGKPILIDTLSFERYEEGKPWVAYRQFCQHFLAPLALAVYCDVRLSRLSELYLDGIPLDLASSLLPLKSHLSMGLKLHIHIHARSQQSHAGAPLDGKVARHSVSKHAHLGLIDSLESTVTKLAWQLPATEWGSYYDDTNYSPAARQHKLDLVRKFIAESSARAVWDFGANNGLFSRLASDGGIFTVAADVDPVAVEKNYLDIKVHGEQNLLPLWIDLINPTPGIGWLGRERDSLIGRGPADLGLALALVHHLAIGNNLPLTHIADFFAQCCRKLVIEFVPKDDSQVQRLLATREDIFDAYTEPEFERAFEASFTIAHKAPVEDSRRVVYLMDAIVR